MPATTNRLHNGAFGHGCYVVSGDHGTLVTSTNAVDWTVSSLGVTNNLGNVAFGNGRFITHGYAGDVAMSSNGVDWAFAAAVPQAAGAAQFNSDTAFANDRPQSLRHDRRFGFRNSRLPKKRPDSVSGSTPDRSYG